MKDREQELMDARFRDYINHQSELKSLKAAQEEQETTRRIRNAEKARIFRNAEKARIFRNKKKWKKVGKIAAVTAVVIGLSIAQEFNLISPLLAIPVMFAGFIYALINFIFVWKVCAEERSAWK